MGKVIGFTSIIVWDRQADCNIRNVKILSKQNNEIRRLNFSIKMQKKGMIT